MRMYIIRLPGVLSDMKILFVCTGNTCRSAMCEAYFNSLCTTHNCDNLCASSAGTDAWDGEHASMYTITALAGYDTKIATHRARCLTKEILAEADLVIALTESHRQRILRLDPRLSMRTKLLGEYGENGGDIRDPFGGGADIYSLCFETMKAPLDRLFEQLSKIANITTQNS